MLTFTHLGLSLETITQLETIKHTQYLTACGEQTEQAEVC